MSDCSDSFIEQSRHLLTQQLATMDPDQRVRRAMSPTDYETANFNGQCYWSAAEMIEHLKQSNPIGNEFLLEMLIIGRNMLFRHLSKNHFDNEAYEMT
jgi:hypothetical protein